MSSRHHFPTMAAKIDPIRSGGSLHCEVFSHQWLTLFHNDVFWEHVVLVKVPITTLKNSVALSANSRRTGGPRTCLKCSRVTLSLNLTHRLVQIPAASRIWTAWKMWSEQTTGCELSGARRQALSHGTISETARAMTQDGSLIMLSSLSSISSK